MPKPPKTHVSDAAQCWGAFWARDNNRSYPWLREEGLHREDGPAFVRITDNLNRGFEYRLTWIHDGVVMRDTHTRI